MISQFRYRHQMSQIPQISQLFFCYLVVAIVTSCGDFDDDQPSQNLPLIVHPTEKEISQGQVVDHEYLVAFKNHDQNHHLWSQDLDFNHYKWLTNQDYYHQFIEGGIVSDIDFISRIPLSRHDPFSHHDLLGWFSEVTSAESNTTQYAHISLVKFSGREQATHVLQDLLNSGKIWFAEPNHLAELTNVTNLRNILGSYQEAGENFYYIKKTKIDLALDHISRKSSNQELERIRNNPPVVAILDSGVDNEHPALKNKLADVKGFKTHCGKNVNGCNTAAPKCDSFPKQVLGNDQTFPIGSSAHGEKCGCKDGQCKCDHGTHVAGIAVGYEKDKVFGACPFCLFLPVRITRPEAPDSCDCHKTNKCGVGSITNDAILRAMQYIATLTRPGKNGGVEPVVRIINSSFGSPTSSRSIAMFTEYLHNIGDIGIVQIAAAGNEESPYRAYPAGYGSVLAVSNIQNNYQKHFRSNVGKWVGIAAFGDNILSSQSGGGTDQATGTSQAAPIVSGIAGLLLGLKPSSTADHIISTLRESSERTELYKHNDKYKRKTSDGNTVLLLGQGIVNAKKAVDNISHQSKKSIFVTRVNSGCEAQALTLPKEHSSSSQAILTSRSLVDFGFALLFVTIIVMPIMIIYIYLRVRFLLENDANEVKPLAG
ncbi:MAG: S8 family serine peptidase [Proteobacteria bacterium]|nr:S8 family serine peptidase [Pseudomonadota bacterium]